MDSFKNISGIYVLLAIALLVFLVFSLVKQKKSMTASTYMRGIGTVILGFLFVLLCVVAKMFF